jgi:hypothetical protein
MRRSGYFTSIVILVMPHRRGRRPVAGIRDGLDRLERLHPLHDLAEHRVAAVELG